MANGNSFVWPSFSREEREAVSKTLMSGRVNYWTGDECRKFEQEFADWVNVKYAIALMNGTVALELALRAAGIGPGSKVVVTPRSFFASVSCVVNVGATPIFVDVDLNSGNISVDKLKLMNLSNVDALICVHLAGWPCEMDSIMELAARNRFLVIEDCAQAHGAIYKGRNVGGIGHIGVWSFCQDKIITTGGEGGMVACNDKRYWNFMRSFKDHGQNFDKMKVSSIGLGFRLVHDSFGSNYRMTEMQAVIGRLQLKKLENWSAKRNANAQIIKKSLMPFTGKAGILRIPSWCCGLSDSEPCMCRHAYDKYYAYICPERLSPKWNRDRIVSEINSEGVPCFTGSCPEIYLETAFNNSILRPKKRLENAKLLGETSIMFLVHPTLTKKALHLTTTVICRVLQQATR